MVKSTTKKYTYAVGRRKSAVVTIKLYSGKGDFTVNGNPVDKYFPGDLDKISYLKPFTVTDTIGKYHFDSKIVGGGKTSQLVALTLAIARSLKKIDEKAYLDNLRSHDLLSVDSRVRERRKVGTGGKARRAKQSPKR